MPTKPKYPTVEKAIADYIKYWSSFYERLEKWEIMPRTPLEYRVAERYAREVMKIPPPPPESAYDFVRRWISEFMRKTLGEKSES
jgi:hypothetical protein